MRIVIFSRYPGFDKLAWKENALRNLTSTGNRPVALIYDRVGPIASLKEGLKRYGMAGLTGKMKRIYENQREVTEKMFSKKLKLVAKELKIPVHYVRDHNSNRCERILERLEPDLILLWGAGIIKKEILKIPKIGTLNGHYAILPKIRGMNVNEWSILLGEETGVTIHFVSPGVDLGDILYIRKFDIEKGDTLLSMRLKCQKAIGEAFPEVVREISAQKHKSIRQKKGDGKQYFIMNAFLKNILNKKLESMHG